VVACDVCVTEIGCQAGEKVKYLKAALVYLKYDVGSIENEN
jgi:hypothetical protein